jgi:hypothetical protein
MGKLVEWRIFYRNLYMVEGGHMRDPRVRIPEKTRKYIPCYKTLLKIRIFHSSHFGTAEYNAIWSRKCGVVPNPKEERNCLPHVEAHESASDPWPARRAGASDNACPDELSCDE